MSANLEAVVAAMSATYDAPERIAQSSQVSAAEVQAAWSKAEPGTVQAYCLGLLAQCHPVPKSAAKAAPKVEADAL
ncbi:MAG: hypothetical protein WBI20_14860 [Burkholderiaceae bacterium]